jgi:hypothetical protein
MTTICYRDGIMVSDSKITRDNYNTGNAKKLFRIKGYLVGMSGQLHNCQKFIDLFKDRPLERVYEDVSGSHIVVVCPRGKIYTYENGFRHRVHNKYETIGSGSYFARAAMYLGNSAPEALKVAMVLDNSSGGRMQKLILKGV